MFVYSQNNKPNSINVLEHGDVNSVWFFDVQIFKPVFIIIWYCMLGV